MKRSILPLAIPWLMLCAAALPEGAYSIDVGRFVVFVVVGIGAVTLGCGLAMIGGRRG